MKVLIPKIIHQVNIGNRILNDTELNWQNTWKTLNPEWDFILWDDLHVTRNLHITHPDIYNRCENYSEKSDILRFEILYQFGGLYIDTDFECLKPIDNLMINRNIVLFQQQPKKVAGGFFAATKNNSFVRKLIDGLPLREEFHYFNRSRSEEIKEQWRLTEEWVDNSDFKYGPSYITDTLGIEVGIPDGSASTQKTVYPYLWTEMHRRHENFRETHPEAYAVHHWNGSWVK
jgi:hypothetical protein